MNLVQNERIDILIASDNGKTLLKNLINNSVDIILLDINMPIMDGIETIEHLKYLYPNIKVIMFSSEPPSEVLDKVMSLGAHKFLPKNSTIKQITDSILEVYDGFQHIDFSK